MEPARPPEAGNFLRTLIADDLRAGRHHSVATRFPPEPNGYLHIGHAKSICLNFGLAREFNGTCNLRFDDTNPIKEDIEYVASIQADVRWLGFTWDGLYFASDYFEQLYQLAEDLIEDGRAYVDDLDEAGIRAYRGTVAEPGRPSPWRDRPVAENLDLFRRMRAGEFADGARVLRGKCDMSAANMKMRDPLLYRIRHDHHHRTGSAWCIYPMYDYAHPLSDALEAITHSICTLEFENNRDLYDWVIHETKMPARPRQYEFARLALTYTITSKRKLLLLVQDHHVSGWDDPRMPTLAGLRRRGVTPEAIRAFCDRVGVAKANSMVDIGALDVAIRDDLNLRSPRMMAVLDPVKLVLEDWPADRVETLDAPFWPHDVPNEGARSLAFGRELWIDRADFAEEPPPKFHRLAPGREVRLRYGYVVKCIGVEKDAAGNVVTVRCTHAPSTRGGNAPDGRKIAGTLHWVSAATAVPLTVRLYDRLFVHERPDAGEEDFRVHLNPRSLTAITALAEPAVAALLAGAHVQLERTGYFFTDPIDSAPGAPVLNRVVALKDTWAKVAEAVPETTPREKGTSAAPKPSRPAPRPAPLPPDRADDLTPDQAARFARYTGVLGVPEDDAAALAGDDALAALFDTATDLHPNAPSIATFLLNELPRDARNRADGAAIGRLVGRTEDGTISARAAKEVLTELLAGATDPDEIIARRGLRQVSDRGALTTVVAEIIAKNPSQLAAFRAGRTALLGYFVGEVMKATRGTANPGLVQELVREALA